MLLDHLKAMDQLSEKKLKEERQILRLELSTIQKSIQSSKNLNFEEVAQKIRIKEQSILQNYQQYYLHFTQLKALMDHCPYPYRKILWARYVEYLPWSKILPHQKHPAPYLHPEFLQVFRELNR